jgi:hypothetical protein
MEAKNERIFQNHRPFLLSGLRINLQGMCGEQGARIGVQNENSPMLLWVRHRLTRGPGPPDELVTIPAKEAVNIARRPRKSMCVRPLFDSGDQAIAPDATAA